mgnify:CR=1 FL=1
MKIKVFELDFDASNLHEVEFVKSVISGANLSSSIPCDTTAQLKVESPVEVKEIAAVPVTEKAPRKVKAGKEAPAPEPAPEPVVEPAPAPEPVVEPAPETETSTDEQPTAKEMQDLVISLSKSGKLTRDEIMSIFHEFGGTSLMKIAPAKFALLKQRLITYKD